jgi:subtilisin-like proprotein convertase family protein
MSLRLLSFLGVASLPILCLAQTFQGQGAAIPDNGNTLEIPLGVNGLGNPLNAASFGLEQVCITINHSYISDLDVSLVAPDGTVVLLVSGQGGSTDHYNNTCFRQDATTSILQGTAPYSGTYRPQGDLGLINNGQDGNGEWNLKVLDTYPFADQGSVITWGITFGNEPAVPYVLASSNLPIVVINTNGQDIPNDVKITAQMGIVNNGAGLLNHPTDPYTDYNGTIGIEIRGNSSDGLSPKKSYTVELRDGTGADFNAAILGMPSESDWVLLANYFDKSLMNNSLTYYLARAMGRYAPRTRDVEVVLNGEYIGVYTAAEKIKRGAQRVDIAKLQPTEVSGDDLTGGYILSVDRNEGPGSGFTSSFPPVVNGSGQTTFLQYRYPKADDIVPQQRAYIQAYVDSFETALAGPDFADPEQGFRAYANDSSFIDLFLINELSRNVDGYRLSNYLYKDKYSNGGKLHAGPAWDYDIAWGNANYCDGSDITGWAYAFGAVCPGDGNQIPFWWQRFLEDSTFQNAVRCRWNELRNNVLSPARVEAYADSVANLLDAAQQRNFYRWPILGTYVWPNPEPVPTTYAGEVQELKDFMNARWAWMDAHLPGTCASIGIAGPAALLEEPPFPDPFQDEIQLRLALQGPVRATLVDALGREVLKTGPLAGRGQLQRIAVPPHLCAGPYVLLLVSPNGITSTYRLVH